MKLREAVCGLPINAALAAASVHDNQVAIPLMKNTREREDYLYDLMNTAYDAQPIYEVSRSLGHVPIIDRNTRGKDVVPLVPHEAVRYRERTVAERFNSRLKEGFGASSYASIILAPLFLEARSSSRSRGWKAAGPHALSFPAQRAAGYGLSACAINVACPIRRIPTSNPR